MKGLIVATHGQLSAGLKDAVDVITGMGDSIEVLSLNREDNVDDYEQNFKEVVSKYNENGSLVLVDMVGGSPYNVSLKHLDNNNYEVVAGVNLMMIIEVLNNLNNLSITELSNLAMTVGRQSVQAFPVEEEILEQDMVEEYVEESYGAGGKITFARVDHRLIHGQVITKWSKIAQANTIIIVDDELYQDKMMADIYRSAAPVGVEVIIAPSKVISYAQKHDTLPSGNVMLLFKDIKGVQNAYDEGIRLENLQLGGIPNDGTRDMVFTAVSLSKKDLEVLDKVSDTGTIIELQVVPEERGMSYQEAKSRVKK